ncbi:UNVERIFIED_CONTAM: hypothetical protein Sindi_2860900 [Sesamum indicum]
MDSYNSLSPNSHTSTPQITHTQPLGSNSIDGDGGDDGEDEGCDEEGVQTTDALNMMVERLQKMATDNFGGDLRRRPTLGFASAKSRGSHGEHGSIFHMLEFSKLAYTVIDARDKQALDALRELNNKEAITTPFLPRVRNIRPPVRRVEKTETPYPKPLEPAVDWSQPPSTDAGQLVAEYVSNTGYVTSENRTAEMVEDGALDLVNIDSINNNTVNVENVKQDLINNDLVNGDLVNNDPIKIDLVNKDAINVKIMEQDFVNDDLVNGDLVNKDPVNVDVDGEKDKDKDVDTVNSNDTVGFGQQRTYETNSTHAGLFIWNIPLQSYPISGADDKITDDFNNSSLGTGNDAVKIKTYTGPNLDKIEIFAGRIVDRGRPSTVASGIGRPLYPDAITRACTRLDFARVCVMLDVSSKLPKHIIIMMPNEKGGEIP